jgi:hypothetical protein
VKPTRPRRTALVISAILLVILVTISQFTAFDDPLDGKSIGGLDSGGFGFDAPPAGAGKIAMWLAVRILAGLILYAAVCYAIRFAGRLREGDPVYRRWLWIAIGVLVVNIAVLLLIWPGFWTVDSYFVMAKAQQNWISTWQSVFTAIYFPVSMVLIPSVIGPVIVQVIFGSIVAGYVVARTIEVLRRPWLGYALILPFLTLPVLLFDQYPLRSTVHGYIELAVVFRILIVRARPELVADRYREFVFLSAAITLLAFWRAECVLYLLLIPMLAVTLRVFRLSDAGARRRSALVAGSLVAAVVLVNVGVAGVLSNVKYSVTAIVNPLSVMLHQPLGGPDLKANLAAIDRVIDLDLVREMPSAYDIPSYWTDRLMRPDYAAHMGELQRAYISLVAQNPGAFLEARLRTFLATNSLGDFPRKYARGLEAIYSAGPLAATRAVFEERNPSMVPFDRDLQEDVIRAFLLLDAQDDDLPLGPLIWNAIPALGLMIVCFVGSLLRRSWVTAGVLGILLARAGIVFATAPARYFMYYFFAYLVGGVVVLFLGVRALDRILPAPRGKPRTARGTERSGSESVPAET